MGAKTAAKPKPAAPAWPAPKISPNVRDIPLGQLEPDPDQPRKEFDADSLAALAGSLRELGQLQPIRVRRIGDEHRYIVVDGERRYRAARRPEANLRTLQCVVVEDHSDPGELLVEQLAANEAREDLTPLERAEGYAAAIKARGWTQGQLAAAIGKRQSTVSKLIALLRLPEEVRDLIASGDLDASTAYEIAAAAEWERVDLANLAAGEGWTRDEVAAEVRWMAGSGKPPRTRAERLAAPHATSHPSPATPAPGAPITADGAATTAAGANTGPPARPGNGQAGAPVDTIRERVLIYDRPPPAGYQDCTDAAGRWRKCLECYGDLDAPAPSGWEVCHKSRLESLADAPCDTAGWRSAPLEDLDLERHLRKAIADRCGVATIGELAAWLSAHRLAVDTGFGLTEADEVLRALIHFKEGDSPGIPADPDRPGLNGVVDKIEAEDAAIRERGVVIAYDDISNFNGTTILLASRGDPLRTVKIAITPALNPDQDAQWPGMVEALRLALAEALRRWPEEALPGVDYDPLRDAVPEGVAQCNGCHRRRLLGVQPCPQCKCPEFSVAKGG